MPKFFSKKSKKPSKTSHKDKPAKQDENPTQAPIDDEKLEAELKLHKAVKLWLMNEGDQEPEVVPADIADTEIEIPFELEEETKKTTPVKTESELTLKASTKSTNKIDTTLPESGEIYDNIIKKYLNNDEGRSTIEINKKISKKLPIFINDYAKQTATSRKTFKTFKMRRDHLLKNELKRALAKILHFSQDNKQSPYSTLLENYRKSIDPNKKVDSAKHLLLIELSYRLLFLAEYEGHPQNKPDGANTVAIKSLASKLSPKSCFRKPSKEDLTLQSAIEDVLNCGSKPGAGFSP